MIKILKPQNSVRYSSLPSPCSLQHFFLVEDSMARTYKDFSVTGELDSGDRQKHGTSHSSSTSSPSVGSLSSREETHGDQ